MPKQPPTTPNPDLLKERLITKEGLALIPQRGTLSKCAIRFRDYLQAYHALVSSSTAAIDTSDSTTQELEQLQQNLKNAQSDLITELKLHDLEMRKVSLASQSTITELQHYENLYTDTNENIIQIRKDIDVLKEKLTHEQKVRKHREEYEDLAKMASKRPSVYITKRKLEQVHKDIEEIEVKKKRTSSMIDMKRKQFHGLMQNIFDLKNSLEEDDVRKEIEKNVNQLDDKAKEKGEEDVENLYGDLSTNDI